MHLNAGQAKQYSFIKSYNIKSMMACLLIGNRVLSMFSMSMFYQLKNAVVIQGYIHRCPLAVANL